MWRFLAWLLGPAPDEGWTYSDEGRRRTHTDGRVQVWNDEDMDEWHGGFWRDAD